MEEMSVQLRMKEHVVDVLQAKKSELEREVERRGGRIQEMRVKERMYEELETKFKKREEMLKQRTSECDKVRGLLDKKDMEIGKLKKDLRMLSATPSSPGNQFLKLKNDKERLEGENKGHVRELKMLRSIAKGRVSEVAKEGSGALQSAVSKLKEMEEEMEKVKRMVQEGEKLKIFLENVEKENREMEVSLRAERGAARVLLLFVCFPPQPYLTPTFLDHLFPLLLRSRRIRLPPPSPSTSSPLPFGAVASCALPPLWPPPSPPLPVGG